MGVRRVVITVLGLASAAPANAQQLPAGTRVRLTTPATFTGWRVGHVTTMTQDSVRLTYATGDSATIALADIGLMDSGGKTHPPLWAILSSAATVPAGGLVGIMTALSVSAAKGKPVDKFFDQAVNVGFGVGLVAGVAIAVTQKTESWTPVLLPTKSQVASDSRATETRVYRPRMRVKLRVDHRKVVGTLVEQRGDSIVLARNSAHTSYPVANITDVRVSRGKSVWTGARFGGLIGAAIGLLQVAPQLGGPNDVYDPIDSECDPNTESCRYESDLVHAAKWMGGYTLAGAVVGGVIRRERWVKGKLPTSSSGHREPARLLLAPSRNGMRIGVHATF